MSKLSDYIDKKREEEENILAHNIITNDSAFQKFIENVEDLDFSASFISEANGKGIYDLKVLLDESPIKFPNSEGYPYTVRIDTDKKELYVKPNTKSYVGNETLENLDIYLNDTLQPPVARKIESEDKADIAVRALKDAINS